jgi:pimeloyl-ACP methyl ester carboxylesterase
VRSPGRLTGLVALDSFPNPEESPDAIRAQAREVLARGTRAVIEELACDELEPPPQWLVEHLCTTHAVAFAGSIEAEATEPDLWAAAPTLDVPVLLVLGRGGDGDPLAERLVREMPHARRVILDVAHLAAFHRTDLTLPLFRPFLESVSARPDVPH